MITLPPGFDVTTLMDEFFQFCVPFIEIAAILAAFVIISKILSRG